MMHQEPGGEYTADRAMSMSIRSLLDDLGDGPLFVHSGAPGAAALLAEPDRGSGPGSLREIWEHCRASGAEFASAVTDEALTALRRIAEVRPLWLPAFNYDFTRTLRFDPAHDPSQVGPVSERFRRSRAAWRTPVPVFSVCGDAGEPPVAEADEHDPFGDASAFAELERRAGAVLFVGAPFSSATIVHRAEHEPPAPYRYVKAFQGVIVRPDGSTSRHTTLRFRVRPAGRDLRYDWERLMADARDAGVLNVLAAPEGPIMACSVARLLAHWRARLDRDALFLLDAESRAWVGPMLDALGRGFELADFEPTDRPPGPGAADRQVRGEAST
jgi:aminoglycoside N3'-acetyltransferase